MNTSNKNNSPEKPLYVAGVGASAGGLDALSKLLSVFNGSNSEFCVVIVMHLSPDYKSELASILGKRCKWPVETVSNNIEMKPRHIYVTPQNKDIHIKDDFLILDELPKNYSSAPSIDNFFSSLAQSKGKHAIGIVLSGYGQDGSNGIQEIKNKYGFTIAQLPETAEHKDMPASAIATKNIDAILPVEQIFDEINQYIINIRAISSSPKGPKSIDAIFDLLEKRSGTDFSLYKPSTIMRRINYRMANLQLNSLTDYFGMIKNSPKELDILFETVLIGVTQFFRDDKAFESLRETLETYLEAKKPGDSIRIWCVGCATGEEPYSIAILLNEILQNNINKYQVQIFASDIDEKALNIARQGIYKKESLDNLPQALIDRYFDKRNGDQYQLKKLIKQYTLFTRHDISNDPPFVKLDMVVCRNLLIYFNNSLQKQTFQIFHYSLRPKGLLFLGKSESVGVAADLFSKLTTKKIFKKAEASLDYDLKFSRFQSKRGGNQTGFIKGQRNNMTIVDVAKETLYYKYEHPFAIINENSEIKEVNGSLRLYVEISQGSMNANLFKMANEEFVTPIKALLSQVKKTKVPHVSNIIKFNLYDNEHYVKIRVAPLIYEVSDLQYYLVIFEKIEPSHQIIDLEKKLETEDFVDLRIRELEDELEATREHLQIFTEELEANNEELQTINEELQSANEELKSSNEELETGNEELQSANEELNTANNELRLTNDMLIEKEKELQDEKDISEKNASIYKAIAESIPNGSVGLLNDKFEVEYLSGEIFNVLGLDTKKFIGKSMPDSNPSKIEAKRLRQLCEDTLEGNPGEIEVRYHDRFFWIQTALVDLPHEDEKLILYLTQDITKENKDKIKLQTTLDATDLFIVEYDILNNILLPNPTAAEILGVKEDEHIGVGTIRDKIHPRDFEKAKKHLKKSFKTNRLNLELRLVKDQDIYYYRIKGRLIRNQKKKPVSIIASVLDITKDKSLLNKVVESEERFKNIANAAPMIIWITDVNCQTIFINEVWERYTGVKVEDALGLGWMESIHPDDVEWVKEYHEKAAQENELVEIKYRIKSKDGTYGWFFNKAQPLLNENGESEGYIGSIVDITNEENYSKELKSKVAEKTKDLKNSNEELLKINMNLESYAHIASHDLQEPIRKIRTFNSFILDKQDRPEDVRKYAKKIEESAKRMTDLIKDILDYSRLTNISEKIDVVDLNNIVDEIKSELELYLKDNGGSVICEDLGTIHGMANLIFQLFSNLIKNGLKYNENTPIIEIESNEVPGKALGASINLNPKTTYKVISFTDNGIGIDNNQFKNIFEPFKRLHSSSNYSGTGIGLAICKRIIDLHQGHIGVESEKGKGSVFTVYLPKLS